MLRGATSKVMWVGRAAVFLVGLAVILALVFGVATMALAAVPGDPFKLGKLNAIDAISRLKGAVNGPMLFVDNDSQDSRATALRLAVEDGKPPLKVNASAGKARNLNADQLDGEEASGFYAAGSKVEDSDLLDGNDTDQILPLVRAQRPASSVPTEVSGARAQTNSVSITAPTDGVFVLQSLIQFRHNSDAAHRYVVDLGVDNSRAATVTVDAPPEQSRQSRALNATVPASAGEHTVTIDVTRTIGGASWSFSDNNLTVMFVPAGRGAVTVTE